jgi:hypothetical protein
MNKNLIIGAVAFLFVANAFVSADVILPGSHRVYCCAKISNISDFPDIKVIGDLQGVSGGGNCFLVNQDSCYNSGYWADRLNFFWTTKSYFDSCGLANLPVGGTLANQTDSAKLHFFSGNLSDGSYLTPDSSKLQTVESSYLLYANGSNLSLFLSNRRSMYSDNTVKDEDFGPVLSVGPSHGSLVRQNTIENIFVKNGIFTFKTEFTGKLNIVISDCKGRTIARQEKWCAPGYTYVSNFSGLRSGLYWMRLKSPHIETTKQLTIVR